jgi:TPP-dependent 2-oxoacid decarboxylase
MKLIRNDREQGDEYLVDRARADNIAEMRGVSGVVNLPLVDLTAKAGKTFWVKAKEGA